ncbi:unnamed protein product [Cuscuta epithymum]|uniref:Inosine/uridine-preferring nucleoside hydrolase domain-containing protein n=1 Tax=Cuscuta epithymum TaxID=186058 RepID=A0AAV0FM15_9ASTE|nr:unnamed protein product [Cuscuta epithymum]
MMRNGKASKSVVEAGFVLVVIAAVAGTALLGAYQAAAQTPPPHRILLDMDAETDDISALLYLLKLNSSEFDIQGITISSNGFGNPGFSMNHIYDMLYMMDRDDIPVGVGGEGGILDDGTIEDDVGGYHPIIDQGNGTAGYCRYRQAIGLGRDGHLDVDTNLGLRKSFLPMAKRRYFPFLHPTAQQVLINTISAGPTTVLMIGSHTNMAIFLMTNPQLKENIAHIYSLSGSIDAGGNLFTSFNTNPYAEFNMFMDPFAAYQVIHSGIPVTLVTLDAANTIPISAEFFSHMESNQQTYEAQYFYKTFKITRDSIFADDETFYKTYYMWDFFMCGVATSIMSKPDNHDGDNEFAEMKYMNITVITTSDENHSLSDGSNPFFDGRNTPKFNLDKEIHGGHVQNGARDRYCIVKNSTGKCKDGYTPQVKGSSEGVSVRVAVKAKPNPNVTSPLDKAFYVNFIDVLNRPQQTGRFNATTEFLCYNETLYKPDLSGIRLGKNVVFDMDMSAGDFLALFYLLKLPVTDINLKAIIVSPNGWADAATIDVVYDVLHMMGRDDIPVALGDLLSLNMSYSDFPGIGGDCKYQQGIPQGYGGFIDSDTLYGLARDLPRSPRGYTSETSKASGGPRDTDHPELRQPLALEVWDSVVKSLDPGSKITILTNGPLTNIANIVLANQNVSSVIQAIVIVGGHISNGSFDRGNVINLPSNRFAEQNMYFDPLAAKIVFASNLNITLIPLAAQRQVSSLVGIRKNLTLKATPEAKFATRLLSRLRVLKLIKQSMETFLGEIIGSVLVAGDISTLKPTFGNKKIKVVATGKEYEDGTMIIDEKEGKEVRVLTNINATAYYNLYSKMLGDKKQSAVIGSYVQQTIKWSCNNA